MKLTTKQELDNLKLPDFLACELCKTFVRSLESLDLVDKKLCCVDKDLCNMRIETLKKAKSNTRDLSKLGRNLVEHLEKSVNIGRCMNGLMTYLDDGENILENLEEARFFLEKEIERNGTARSSV